MANVTRRIGLSLGADICWPLCYEAMIERLNLNLPLKGDTIRFQVKRLEIQPFDLQGPCPYDLVIDRLTHWYHTSREWIKKSVLLNDLYVLNNPWSVQSMEKQTSYCGMMRLGLPIPRTWMVPPKEYEPSPDLEHTLRYAQLFDLSNIGEKLKYPVFMKPYDGGGWVGVTKIESHEALKAAYEQSGKRLMHIQEGVNPHDKFVRTIGLGPQVRYVDYAPDAALHDKYQIQPPELSTDDRRTLRQITLTINTFFGWDFNSCESLHQNETWHPIDFANPCPDSQVTSLHYHFPWLLRAKLRWTLFCAATKRRMHFNFDWQEFFDAADQHTELKDRLLAYEKIADRRLQTAQFEEFCADHLKHLDEQLFEFFATDEAKAAVRKKVEALYPEHEHDEFTDLFWSRIQDWRDQEGQEAATAEA